ncbi:MAG: MBL fold metallo-hydrolase, partial [Caulobacteraceae bacterium]
YLIGRKEFEYWKAEGGEEQQTILADSVTPIVEAGLAELVEPDHVLSAEIRLMPTPGHTPGHVSVVIESEDRKAIISGDALHHPCQMAHPDWSPWFDSDPAASRLTRKALLAQAEREGALFIGTHFAAPTAGKVVKDGHAWRLA